MSPCLSVCRGCLSNGADCKLFDMRPYGLVSAYLHLTEYVLPELEVAPYLCSYCAAMLYKYSAFRDKCNKAQELLEDLLLLNTMVTTEQITSIDRKSNNLTIPLTRDAQVYSMGNFDADIEVKEELKQDCTERVNKYDTFNNTVNEQIETKLAKTKITTEQKNEEEMDENKSSEHDFSEGNESSVISEVDSEKIVKNIATKRTGRKAIKEKQLFEDVTYDSAVTLSDGESVSESDDYAKCGIKRKNTPKICKKKVKKKKLDEKGLNSDKINTKDMVKTEKTKIFKKKQKARKKEKIEDARDSEASNSIDNNLITKNNALQKSTQGNTNKNRILTKKKLFKDVAFKSEYNVDIIILSKEEQLQEIEERKQSDNYNKSEFKCEECFKGFCSKKSFDNHMLKHAPSRGAHSCEVCGYRFLLRYRWLRHRAEHCRRYVCRACGYVARARHLVRVHRRWHDGHLYRCEECGATHQSKTGHLSHMRLLHPGGRGGAACARCGESFVNARGLSTHAWLTAGRCAPPDPPLNTTPDSPEGSTQSGYECSHCRESFLSAASLNTHTQRVHLNKRQPKPRAPHRAPRAPGAPHVPTLRIPPNIVCEICGKKFRSPGLLKGHQLSHEGIRPFKCSLCPKAYTSVYTLKTHLRVHSGERPFSCTVCGRTFASPSNYSRHRAVHSGVKRYKCEVCEKRFSQSNSLKLHVRTVHMRQPAPPRVRAPRARGRALTP